MRPDSELCFTAYEEMSPEEKQRFLSKPAEYWVAEIDRQDAISLHQRIAELENQVTRLQHLVMEIANDHNNWLEDDPETLRSLTRHWARKRSFRAYEWADLDQVKGDDDASS